jgi:hypothetical protein
MTSMGRSSSWASPASAVPPTLLMCQPWRTTGLSSAGVISRRSWAALMVTF